MKYPESRADSVHRHICAVSLRLPISSSIASVSWNNEQLLTIVQTLNAEHGVYVTFVAPSRLE